MNLKMAKKTTQLASYFIVVLSCAVSLVAFSQFRIRCELGDAAELFHPTGHSHANHHHPESSEVASDEAQGHAQAVSHEYAHAHGIRHSHAKNSHTHADTTQQEHTAVTKVAHEQKGSKEDDTCCSSTGFTEFNVSKSFAHLSPVFVTALIQYVIAVLDPVDVSLDLRSELFAKLNAPPPLSPHIPTTVLRI
jgi:hypothetical protein